MNPFKIAEAHGDIARMLKKYTDNEEHKEFIAALYAHILLWEQVARREGREDLIAALKKAALTYRTVTGLADERTRNDFQQDNI